jgi:hypothetical protein
MTRSVQRGVFAAVTAAALGFGGAQAFASPAAPAESERACVGGKCSRDCRSIGYDDGICDQGSCICIILVPGGA